MAKRQRPRPDPKDPRFRNHTRLTVYIAKDLDEAIRAEARKRDLTLSQLVEEAFLSRNVMMTRSQERIP